MSHGLWVSHARREALVTGAGKPTPAGGTAKRWPRSPQPSGPLPFAPDQASRDARPVRAQTPPTHTHTAHLPEVLGTGPASPTARSPIGSPWLLPSARSDLGRGRDTNFQPAHPLHCGSPRTDGSPNPVRATTRCPPPRPADRPCPRPTGPTRRPGPRQRHGTAGSVASVGRGSLTRCDARSLCQSPSACGSGAV